MQLTLVPVLQPRLDAGRRCLRCMRGEEPCPAGLRCRCPPHSFKNLTYLASAPGSMKVMLPMLPRSVHSACRASPFEAHAGLIFPVGPALPPPAPGPTRGVLPPQLPNGLPSSPAPGASLPRLSCTCAELGLRAQDA